MIHFFFFLDSKSEDKASGKKQNGPQSFSENWDLDKLLQGTSSAPMASARKDSFGLERMCPELNVSRECARAWPGQQRNPCCLIHQREQSLLKQVCPRDTVVLEH